MYGKLSAAEWLTFSTRRCGAKKRVCFTTIGMLKSVIKISTKKTGVQGTHQPLQDTSHDPAPQLKVLVGQDTTKSRYLLLILLLLFSSQCASTRQAAEPVNWGRLPGQALFLSHAIADGMRYLVTEVFISSSWFQKTEVSLFAGRREILRARIAFIDLQQTPRDDMVVRWRLRQQVAPAVTHVTTFYFDSQSHQAFPTLPASGNTVSRDKLFLDILQAYPLTSFPNRLMLVFWRNRAKRQAFAQLDLRGKVKDRFTQIKSLRPLRPAK